MRYYRRVVCEELKINALFDDQAKALRLFTKLYDGGYPQTKLEDYFPPAELEVSLDDNNFKKLLKQIK